MGEGCEIAAGAEGAAGGDDGEEVVLEPVCEAFNDRGADAAVSAEEHVSFEEEHPADDVGRGGGADADGVRDDEVFLEEVELLEWDADVFEVSEAGVYAIDGGIAIGDFVDPGATAADASEAAVGEGDVEAVAEAFVQQGEIEVMISQLDLNAIHHSPSCFSAQAATRAWASWMNSCRPSSCSACSMLVSWSRRSARV